MRVQVNVSMAKINVSETFDGGTPEDIVGKMKARVAKELSFIERMAINAMGNLAFAQEVVRRYNDLQNTNLPIPNSCQEFLILAEEQGLAKTV